MSCVLFAAAEDQTEACGRSLAASLPQQQSRALKVFLWGELGAGKTTWVRGFLRELGVTGRVRSPSFSLVEHYELPLHHVIHVDLYRLSGAADVRALGLVDHDVAGAVWLIEWPERAANALGSADLTVRLTAEGQGRRIEVESMSPEGADWLAGSARSLSQ